MNFEAMASKFLPEHVTPLVLYMVHEKFEESGKLFEAAAQWYGAGKILKEKNKKEVKDDTGDNCYQQYPITCTSRVYCVVVDIRQQKCTVRKESVIHP